MHPTFTKGDGIPKRPLCVKKCMLSSLAVSPWPGNAPKIAEIAIRWETNLTNGSLGPTGTPKQGIPTIESCKDTPAAVCGV